MDWIISEEKSWLWEVEVSIILLSILSSLVCWEDGSNIFSFWLIVDSKDDLVVS